MERAAGILGIGVYLPENVRRNDYWPAAVVDRWRQKSLHRIESVSIERTEGVQRALDAMAKLRNDPFNGSVERRVMDSDQWSSEMETVAAQRALADAGIDAAQIDALISFTLVPDYLCGPTGCVVHERLGLPQNCLTLSLDSACNSFPVQLTLADQMIRSGSARYVLLVQSAAFSRLVPDAAPVSPWLGDAATAVVVGPAPAGKGVLAATHRTDGTHAKGMVFGVPGKRWYEEGRTVCYAEDPEVAQVVILGAIDRARQVIPETLEKVGLRPSDVDFYGCHQGVPWLRPQTQEACGMDRARTVDTYTSFASVGAANLPLVMSVATREGLLREGDLVVLFSGGSGETWSSVALRWGRD
jgi:3-oxoacyl-[acyl-carrier-protein] synthase-3